MAFYLKQPISGDVDQIELKDARITLLEKEAVKKDINISNLNKQLEIAAAKSEGFEQIKIEKARAEERLKIVETERNILKNETISFQKAEEGRQKEANKNFATAVTLQKSLEKEKERLNDVRVKERENQFNKMKLKSISFSKSHNVDFYKDLILINFPSPKKLSLASNSISEYSSSPSNTSQ